MHCSQPQPPRAAAAAPPSEQNQHPAHPKTHVYANNIQITYDLHILFSILRVEVKDVVHTGKTYSQQVMIKQGIEKDIAKKELQFSE